MKKSNKTAKNTVPKNTLNKSLPQTEDKAPIESSQKTVKKTPIKSSGQSKEITSIKSSKQIKEETLLKPSQQTKEKVPIKSSQQSEKKAPLASSPKTDNKGIKKQYLKSKPVCKVTFRLPKDAAPGAKRVSVVGDFNNWNSNQSLMKKQSNGDFALTLELPCSGEYHFRYLVDAQKWENDWCADKYIPTEFGEDNSVVIV